MENSAVAHQDNRPVKGRLAPSPTGVMHAGNIFSALLAWLMAKSAGGTVVLRIEDLDPDRSKAAFADKVMRDFEALGLYWDEGPFFQSQHSQRYEEALKTLDDMELLYPCYCSRADLHAASAPHSGEKLVYSGHCRPALFSPVLDTLKQKNGRWPALRLTVPDRDFAFKDAIQGPFGQNLAKDCGDFIVRRSDAVFAYQLASVLDDIDEGITSVVRGVDLLDSTPQQLYLYELFNGSAPHYGHGPLLVAPDGRRLAKRNNDATFDAMVEKWGSASAVLGKIAWLSGLSEEDGPVQPEDLLADFCNDQVKERLKSTKQIVWDPA